MLTRFLTTVGSVSVIALAMAGCAGDDPQPAPMDAGVRVATRCEPPLAPCEGACADLSGDPSSCGECGHACADDESCEDGACQGRPPDDAGSIAESSVGSCCETQGTSGCEDAAIEACVCAVDRLCCAGAWDDRCVALVEAEGCGQCGPAPSSACEAGEASDAVPSMLRGTLGGSDGDPNDALELSCGSIAEPELLFAFTAPEAGSYSFSTATSEVFDTVLAVVDGAACDGAELGCNDDDGSELSSRVVLELAEGQEVLVAVESWGEESGEVEVQVAASGGATVIETDSCVASELATTLPASVTGEASDDANLLTPSCALYGSAGEAFYRFTAEQDGRYRFDTRGSDADTLVQVLDGDCTAEELACNDDSELGGLAAIADLDLSAGQTVLINVDSFDGSGSYMLTVDRVDPTVDDSPAASAGDCCSAQLDGGCDDTAIAACVCAVDDYCCTTEWDALCVDAVTLLECGGC